MKMKKIMLELHFTGKVLNEEQQYVPQEPTY